MIWILKISEYCRINVPITSIAVFIVLQKCKTLSKDNNINTYYVLDVSQSVCTVYTERQFNIAIGI